MTTTRAEIRNVSKSFPGVKALQKVNLSVATGEIHALCGENGAGKSTLMNILSGNLLPDEGEILLNGSTVHFGGPRDALEAGIAVVHQHLSLANALSVAENVFANQQPVNRWGVIDIDLLHRQTRDLLSRLDIHLEPSALVQHLSAAQKQLVEIAKALAKDPQLLILDEPTASLTDESIRTLFRIIVTLKQTGTSIIYISHRPREIYELADQISVLKDGKFQGTFSKDDLPRNELIKLMVGRDVESMQHAPRKRGAVVLEVKQLSSSRFRNITFNLHKGEILGLAGLIGAGRTEIARAIFGADKYDSGDVMLHGRPVRLTHPSQSVRSGISYVPEDRKNNGLFPALNIADNMLSTYFERNANTLIPVGSAGLAESLRRKLHIATPSLQQAVVNLSGGNQQKTMLAKWLATNPEVLIVDEPTHGVDIGAKHEIYKILTELASNGMAILLISSELPELLGLCDRILVVKQGELTGELSSGNATEQSILSLAM